MFSVAKKIGGQRMAKGSGKSGYNWSFLQDLRTLPNGRNSNTDKVVDKAFAGNIVAKKNTAIYGAHTYHTKVPPEGIIPYLRHYTQPGDVILDPFCGSGMTGVAAQLLSADSECETRKVLLNDLGPAACHIAYNHTEPVSPAELDHTFADLKRALQGKIENLYSCWHAISGGDSLHQLSLAEAEKLFDLAAPIGERIQIKVRGRTVILARAVVVSTIWSEAYECPLEKRGKTCGHSFLLWDVAMNPATGAMKKEFKCPSCEGALNRMVLRAGASARPAQIEYEYRNPVDGSTKRAKRAVYKFEEEWIEKLSRQRIPYWYPTNSISPKREMMTMGPARLGIKSVDGFYFRRNLRVCAQIWDYVMSIKNLRLRYALAFACTNTFWHATRMRRYNARGGARPLTGTLYVPQISVECNVMRVLEKKIGMLRDYYELVSRGGCEVHVSNSSATELRLKDNSVDYIFTDPPFGGNIYYSDCSIIWEAWLGRFTEEASEIHFNRIRKPEDGGKTREDYRVLIESAFLEMYRVLRPGKWASVMFNNSDDNVLETFRNAAVAAGFEMSDVQLFDKGQKSFKGYMGRDGKQNVPNCDVVLNLRKPLTTEVRSTKTISQAPVSDKWILDQLKKYLTAVARRESKKPMLLFNDAEDRTTPFMHSHVMKELFAKSKSFRGFTFDHLKRLCREHFVCVNERWYLPEEDAPQAASQKVVGL